MKVLVLNPGSSSLKVSLYELGDSVPETPALPLWEGQIDSRASSAPAEFRHRNSGGSVLKERLVLDSPAEVIKHALGAIWSGPTQAIAGPSELTIVGQRVVHGGRDYRKPTRLCTTGPTSRRLRRPKK